MRKFFQFLGVSFSTILAGVVVVILGHHIYVLMSSLPFYYTLLTVTIAPVLGALIAYGAVYLWARRKRRKAIVTPKEVKKHKKED